MHNDRRWMTSLLKEAAKSEIRMPWARGERRETWIAKRTDAQPVRATRA